MQIKHQKGSYVVDFASEEQIAQILSVEHFVITDENLIHHWGHLIPNRARCLTLKAGEESKSISTFEKALSWLLESGASRNSKLVAFGGGVIGDLAGFVASTYMRGIEYIQIPTSLLAMVDSSIGGKVAIDLPGGKNVVGSFYPPQQVLIYESFLQTLPERQSINGMAEVLKYGFISDPSLLKEQLTTHERITRCLEIKRRIVEEDEFETSGLRATLNFGHTLGHALESFGAYKRWLHGEAISIGMVCESKLAEHLALANTGLSSEVASYLTREKLPVEVSLSDEEWGVIVRLMSGDKKRASSGLSFSLIQSVGECKLVHGIAPETVLEVLTKK